MPQVTVAASECCIKSVYIKILHNIPMLKERRRLLVHTQHGMSCGGASQASRYPVPSAAPTPDGALNQLPVLGCGRDAVRSCVLPSN